MRETLYILAIFCAVFAGAAEDRMELIIPAAHLDSNGTLRVDEGSRVDVQIRLADAPTDVVSVRFLSTISQLSATPVKVEFNIGDWHFPKTVRLKAAHDEDTTDATGRLDIAGSGGGYDGETLSQNFVIVDNTTTRPPDDSTAASGSRRSFARSTGVRASFKSAQHQSPRKKARKASSTSA